MRLQSLKTPGSAHLVHALALLVMLFLPGETALGAVSQWTPIDTSNGTPVIEIDINGEPATAMLDSAASTNVISEWMAHHIRDSLTSGGSRRVASFSGFGRLPTVNGLSIDMFGVPMVLNGVFVAPITSSDMIIGVSFFEQHIVQIDYPNQRFRLIERESSNLQAVANVKLRKDKFDGLPIVWVDINEEQGVWLKFDTGNNHGVFLPRSLANKNNWLDKYIINEDYAADVTGVFRAERFNVPELAIGPHRLEDAMIIVPAEGERYRKTRDPGRFLGPMRFGKNYRGVLGFDVLKHFVVTIDYRSNLLHLGLPEELPESLPVYNNALVDDAK